MKYREVTFISSDIFSTQLNPTQLVSILQPCSYIFTIESSIMKLFGYLELVILYSWIIFSSKKQSLWRRSLLLQLDVDAVAVELFSHDHIDISIFFLSFHQNNSILFLYKKKASISWRRCRGLHFNIQEFCIISSFWYFCLFVLCVYSVCSQGRREHLNLNLIWILPRPWGI